MTHPLVGLLHPGQMGAAIAAQARHNNVTVLWCPTGRSPRTVQRAEHAGLTPVASLAELLDQADIVLSICPPAAAHDVAAQVAAVGFEGIYVEANAINPARYIQIDELLTSTGVQVIDAAIIGPPPTTEVKTTLYLAGHPDLTRQVSELFTATTAQPVILDQNPPAASALKMAYASYQKATRVLAAVAHALAAKYDVTHHLITEAERPGRSPLADPDYLPTVAARAWRWAPELHDIADTLTQAHLPPELAQATAHILDYWQADKDNVDLPLAQALQRLTSPPEAHPS